MTTRSYGHSPRKLRPFLHYTIVSLVGLTLVTWTLTLGAGTTQRTGETPASVPAIEASALAMPLSMIRLNNEADQLTDDGDDGSGLLSMGIGALLAVATFVARKPWYR